MLVNRKTALNVLDIWEPKYANRNVLVACYKIQEHNKVIFSKAKHLAGREFYLSGAQARKYPIVSNGKIPCYSIPIDDIEVLEYKEDIAEIARNLFPE